MSDMARIVETWQDAVNRNQGSDAGAACDLIDAACFAGIYAGATLDHLIERLTETYQTASASREALVAGRVRKS